MSRQRAVCEAQLGQPRLRSIMRYWRLRDDRKDSTVKEDSKNFHAETFEIYIQKKGLTNARRKAMLQRKWRINN